MTREQTITGLQHRDKPNVYYLGVLVPADADIAAQIQADGETIARLEAALHNSEAQRVKMGSAAFARQAAPIAHVHIGAGMVSGSPADIAAAAAEIMRIAAVRDAAISALAEEGRKRGEAEAIIADMLRLDHEGSEEEWRALCVRARAVLPADGDATR